MKILQINKYHYPRSGSDVYMLNISSALKEKGHTVLSFAMQRENNIPSEHMKYFVENIEYEKELNGSFFRKLQLGIKIIYSLEARKKLLQLIEAEKPDIAHIHKFNNTLTPSILYALKKMGVPVVQTLHDYRTICPNYNLYDFNMSEICEDCKGHNYFNAISRRCQKSSYLIGLNIALESYLYHFLKTYKNNIDLYMSSSSFMRDKMIEFGVDENKIIHLPNFVDINKYSPVYESEGYILYFGRIERHKGVHTLIEAMKHVSGCDLHIVGEGSYRDDLKANIGKAKMNNVFFYPYKTGEELTRAITGSLFTIVPSEWYENCPMSVIESLALGKPVIGADIGGIPEMINSGVDGLLFKAGDSGDLAGKINHLLHNDHMIAEMGRNARKKAEDKYNETIHYKMLMDAYRKVM